MLLAFSEAEEPITTRNRKKTIMNRIPKRYISFIPIPALTVIVLTLYLFVNPSLFYEPSWLLPITNTVFVTVVFFIAGKWKQTKGDIKQKWGKLTNSDLDKVGGKFD